MCQAPPDVQGPIRPGSGKAGSGRASLRGHMVMVRRTPAPSSLRADDTARDALGALSVASRFEATADAVIYPGRCEDLLDAIPAGSVHLVVTSPPYNLGK